MPRGDSKDHLCRIASQTEILVLNLLDRILLHVLRSEEQEAWRACPGSEQKDENYLTQIPDFLITLSCKWAVPGRAGKSEVPGNGQ